MMTTLMNYSYQFYKKIIILWIYLVLLCFFTISAFVPYWLAVHQYFVHLHRYGQFFLVFFLFFVLEERRLSLNLVLIQWLCTVTFIWYEKNYLVFRSFFYFTIFRLYLALICYFFSGLSVFCLIAMLLWANLSLFSINKTINICVALQIVEMQDRNCEVK